MNSNQQIYVLKNVLIRANLHIGCNFTSYVFQCNIERSYLKVFSYVTRRCFYSKYFHDFANLYSDVVWGIMKLEL